MRKNTQPKLHRVLAILLCFLILTSTVSTPIYADSEPPLEPTPSEVSTDPVAEEIPEQAAEAAPVADEPSQDAAPEVQEAPAEIEPVSEVVAEAPENLLMTMEVPETIETVTEPVTEEQAAAEEPTINAIAEEMPNIPAEPEDTKVEEAIPVEAEAETPGETSEDAPETPAGEVPEESLKEEQAEEAPAPAQPEQNTSEDNQEEATEQPIQIEYTFLDGNDQKMLLNLLTEHGYYTVAIDDAEVTSGDESAIELIDYIGDYLILPVAPFDSLTVTITTREGDIYEILLHYAEEPEPVLVLDQNAERTPVESLNLRGTMPETAVVTAEQANVQISGEKTIASYEITIYTDDSCEEAWEPVDPITVRCNVGTETDSTLKLYHTSDEGETSYITSVEVKDGWVEFEADSFSAWTLTESLEKLIKASDGNTYKITVTYTRDALLPTDADLTVEELFDPETEEYMGWAENLLAAESFAYARFFDITIVDGQGAPLTPAVPVQVTVELLTAQDDAGDFSVVHFGQEPEKVDAKTAGNTVSFTASSFSVYGIVSGPEPLPVPAHAINTLSDLAASYEVCSFNLSIRRNNKDNYFQKDLNKNSAFVIQTVQADATLWYFEAVDVYANQYRIYTMVDGQKQYMVNTKDNLIGLKETNGTVFELSQSNPAGRFYFKIADQKKWMQYSEGGGGIRFYTSSDNAANCQTAITIVDRPEVPNDVYELDGKSFGLMLAQQTKGLALMAEQEKAAGRSVLKANTLLVRTDPMDRSNLLYVSPDSEMTNWTFHAIEEDQYALTAEVDGTTKYLRIDGVNITLVDEPDSKCNLKVIPGTGANAGKIRLLGVGADNAINYRYYGFTALNAPSESTEWLNLATVSDIYTDSDFTAYSAEKVSISDTDKVRNGSKVIIYTRVWNDETKSYEFYIVDHNGYLARAYESGDAIVWIGSAINTMPYTFTEYYYEGTDTPNYYYDLKNDYSGKYLTPKIDGTQLMSDEPIGVNLNGRREGEYYSTILAWDDPYYDYAGLKTENGRVVSAPMSQAETFYFAIMDEEPAPLTEIDTVDQVAAGITMRLVDFDSRAVQNAFLQDQTASHNTSSLPGLLSNQLGPDGYPTNKSGVSMATLYAGAVPANHLFLDSTYYGSGYYEFDSTLNFASYDSETGNFKVYQELGTIDIQHGSGNTIKHGQFMPLNDLTPGEICRINPQNLYNALGQELTANDPRKGEPLYRIPGPDSGEPNAANYYFGVELSAIFIQPPSGLDAWGHDIIFEFTGDDDFWLYVDGELVLDLGGVHSAIPGNINYRTGKVTFRNATGSDQNTTLYDLFKTHYEQAHPEKTPAEVTEYLNGIFQEKTVKGETCQVFKDYTTHDIRIFFMERGAGASNLRMRFNLASVTPGKVLLSKEITGTDKLDYASAVFPFQIFYDLNDGEGCTHQISQTELDLPAGEGVTVTYQTGSGNVPFRETYTVGSQSYENVFLLKPGEVAAIKMPDNTIGYKVVECGVRNNIYDYAEINGMPPHSTNVNGDLTDYGSSVAAIRDRAQIVFSNHVDPDSLRTITITKRLFDVTGTELTAQDDPTKFKMRVYLGDDLDYYRFGEYSVKDPSGNYCVFDTATGSFSSTGIGQFSDLTPTQQEKATFRSSLNGAIDNIPVGYSVEIRNMLVGTRFMVRELDSDIPLGYGIRHWTEGGTAYDGYKRVEGSYIVTAGEPQNSGVIRDNNDPQIEVHNQRGWGIRANKIWSDAGFMKNHDDIFFAVYVNGSLLDGTVRRIDAYNYTDYYFAELLPGTVFSDYEIKEVELEDAVVDEDGRVTYSAVHPKETGDTLTVGGTPKNGEHEDGLLYTVSYQPGTPEDSVAGLGNIRTDSVTNTRMGGLKILKTDNEGNGLADAVFEVKQGTTLIGTYTSDAYGLVTNAYLGDGAYTLTEVKSPAQYRGIDEPISITVEHGEISVTVDGSPFEGYDSASATLTVRNVPFTLQVIKIDGKTQEPLQDAHFTLYKQVKGVNGPKKDYAPVSNYEDLVSDEYGNIPSIDQTLKPGTYYLTEMQAPDGYELPETTRDVLLTISDTGAVSIDNHFRGILTQEGEDEIAYKITVPNYKPNQKPIVIPTGISIGYVPQMMLLGLAGLIVISIRTKLRKKKEA